MDTTPTPAKAQPKGLEPGIYFNLNEDTYHADPALGSSDVRNLLLSPPDFWWGSSLNPDREQGDDDTAARLRGKAIHKLVLEPGTADFDKLFRRSPHTADMTPSEKAQATKALKAKLPPGVNILSGKDYDRCIIAGAMITKNPKLATAFTGGAAEVSIFWERDGVRCKARIDYLKPRGLGDLKSITNWKKIEFKRACHEAISNYRYDMQAAHYMDGRKDFGRFVAEGMVTGDHDPALLKAVAASKTYAFQFVFFQADKAPVTFSKILSPANPILEVANRDIGVALDRYKTFIDRFGHDSIWLDLEEPSELALEELPAWYARR